MNPTRSRSRRKTESGVTPRADGFEAGLLGCLLIDNTLFDQFDVRPEWFFEDRRRLVCQTCVLMRNKGIPVDAKTLAEVIEQQGQLDELGGPVDGVNFLIELLKEAPDCTSHAGYYAKEVENTYIRRLAVASLDSMKVRMLDKTPLDELPAEFAPVLQSCGYRSERLRPVSAGQLLADHAEMRPAVIDGLLRLGETANIIAAPKTGKSWLAIDLVLCVATGRPWLDRFGTVAGPVLLIDNELHPATLANRMRAVAEARGIHLADVADVVQVIPLRGRLRDLWSLERDLQSFPSGQFKLIVLDAFYRFLPAGTDENDNAAMTQLYNCMDRIGDRLGSANALIHHASKGNQSGRGITDVGSGAGAQSRAVDAHVVLRPHEDDGAVVLDAAVRSWPPVAPVGLRWELPVFSVDPSLDTTQLRRESGRRNKADPNKPTATALDTKGFAAKFVTEKPESRDSIIGRVRDAGFSERQAKSMLERAVSEGHAHRWKLDKHNRVGFATVQQPLHRTGAVWPVDPPS